MLVLILLAACKVVRGSTFQQVTWASAFLFTHGSGEEPARFSQSFKIQAVEKALNPNNRSSQKDLSEALGIGYSTL
jgi:hypothetical protein